MGAVSLTTAKLSVIFPENAVIRTGIAAEDLTKGDPLYIVASTGKLGKGDANASGKYAFAGMALETVSSGQAFDYLEEGWVDGFALTNVGLNYGDFIFLSDAQAYADTPGTYRAVVGRIKGIPNGTSLDKVVHVRAAVVEEYFNGGLY
jgi:hypothetical protein